MIGGFAAVLVTDPERGSQLEATELAHRLANAMASRTGGEAAVHGFSRGAMVQVWGLEPDGHVKDMHARDGHNNNGHGNDGRRQETGHRLGSPLVGSVRLDNRRELLEQLGGDSTTSDLTLARMAFDRWGPEQLSQHLWGDFALAAWDEERQVLVALRDHIGLRRLYFHPSSGLLLVASSLVAMIQTGVLTTDFDRRYFEQFLLEGAPEVGSQRTPVTNVNRLLPGHRLRWNGSGLTSDRYWHPEDKSRIVLDDEQAYYDETRKMMQRAVASRLPERGPIWFDLSGGVDSTSIVYLAEQMLRQRGQADQIRCRSLVDPSMPEASEAEFIEASRAPLGLDVYYQTYQDLPPFSAILGERWKPLEEPSFLYLAYPEFHQLFEHVGSVGGAVHLGGNGGDHVFSPPNLLYLFHLAGQRQWRRARADFRFWLRESYQSMFRFCLYHLIDPGFFPHEILWCSPPAPWFAQRGNESRKRFRWVRHQPLATFPSKADSHHFYHICEGASFLQGSDQFTVERRFPFMDARLIEFLMRLPPDVKARPPLPKGLLRGAMGDLLPAPIQEKWRQPGGDLPFIWKVRRSEPALRKMFESSLLADLGVVDTGLLLDYFNRLIQGDRSHLTTFARTLAAEFWLQGAQRPLITEGHHAPQRMTVGASSEYRESYQQPYSKGVNREAKEDVHGAAAG